MGGAGTTRTWPARRRAAAVLATVTAATVTAALLTGCGAGEEESPAIRPGDVHLSWWAPRGSLAGDADLRDEVAAVVDDWRTPEGAGPHDEATALLWLGEVDGTVLAVVDFRPADNPHDAWLLELTGEPGGLAVTGARDHDGPVVAEDVLPIRSPGVGPRYLASARVGVLTGPDGELPLREDGLTEPVAVPPCRASGFSTHVDSTRYQRVDLGLDVPAPFYPLLPDAWLGEPAAPVLAGVDTCAALAPGGWLHEVGTAEHPAVVVNGFPALTRFGAVPANRPDGVDAAGLPGSLVTLRAEYVATDGAVRRAEWLLWTYPADEGITDVRVPAGVETLVSRPGLLVTRLPDRPVELTYSHGGDDRRTTVTPS
jgi:hypothetical protein